MVRSVARAVILLAVVSLAVPESAIPISSSRGEDAYIISLPLIMESWLPPPEPSIEVVRTGDDTFLVKLPVCGDPSEGVWAEYQMSRFTAPLPGWSFASRFWHLFGLSIVDSEGNQLWRLVAPNSAWEYAYRIGPQDAPIDDFDFYGSVHQAQRNTYTAIEADYNDITALGTGASLTAKQVTFVQEGEIILPSDRTTIAGNSRLVVLFAGCQVRVEHSHTYLPGYELYAAYNAMLPTTNGDSRGIDTYQVGDNLPAVRVYDGAPKNLNTETDKVSGWHSTAHPFVVSMALPSGVPGPDGWSKSGGYKAWFHDIADSNKGKFYVNYVSSNYAERVTAEDSQHSTVYWVERR